ncbi:MAG: DUF3990 domain-containing protein [Prevotellaceae bacterium]|nr:DUF3990 domain-containing protein [Prevotellaceae bacterium]
MITLYHGSYTRVDAPQVNAGRRNLDFGRGFYVTEIKAQAEKWAVVVGSRYNDEYEGVVNVYELDESIFERYHVLRFNTYDIAWLDFVVANRHGEDAAKGYDVVEGGIANDQVIDTVEDYEMRRITAEQALDQLRFKKPNHQICIRNQAILDRHLKFCSCYTIKDKEEK